MCAKRGYHCTSHKVILYIYRCSTGIKTNLLVYATQSHASGQCLSRSRGVRTPRAPDYQTIYEARDDSTRHFYDA